MFSKGRLVYISAAVGLVAAAFVLGSARPGQAMTTSDRAAGLIIWPKIVVDTAGVLGPRTDTVIQLSNTSTDSLKMAHCYYINATSHCANDPSRACNSASDCIASACVPSWNEIDFNIFITEEQPLGWNASRGMPFSDLPLKGQGVCDSPPGRFCTSDSQCATQCITGQSNLGTGIPPVPEDPFTGYLKCVQFDPSQNPPTPDRSPQSNSLIGHATIVSRARPGISTLTALPDVEKYNAVGLRATDAGDTDNVLIIGTEYEACPQTLILDHLFDNAFDPIAASSETPRAPSGPVQTDLTLIPCGANLLNQVPGVITAQFLVFNEFEQRFSTSREVDCFLETLISNIDTPNSLRSIFSANVSGTIAGQTRIRGVGNSVTGTGLIGVARLQGGLLLGGAAQEQQPTLIRNSAAYNLFQQGDSTTPDIILMP